MDDYEQILDEWNTIEDFRSTEAPLTARLVQILHGNQGTKILSIIIIVG